ncbi:hypothetical protein DPMN_181279 [Dreissena polymorpha]|uniref:Uncharacterized protein n=1 Tax=Dreissena polymorpha TaxID=45954 RepID=A0A9D4I557_DREPO|nr:hypothetical protein DPMN_181279 [Dreissena polymorpha]
MDPLVAMLSTDQNNFELIKDFIKTNVLTKFDERLDNIMKNASGSHVFQPTGTMFNHFQDIIGTNRQIKFHEDQTINVTSRMLTRQIIDAARWTTDKRGSQKLTMRTLRAGGLKSYKINFVFRFSAVIQL